MKRSWSLLIIMGVGFCLWGCAGNRNDIKNADEKTAVKSAYDKLSQMSDSELVAYCKTEKEKGKRNPKKSLDRFHIKGCMIPFKTKVLRCFAGRDMLIDFRLTIQPDGKILSVEPTGENANAEEGICISQILKNELVFPATQRQLKIRFPFRLHGTSTQLDTPTAE